MQLVDSLLGWAVKFGASVSIFFLIALGLMRISYPFQLEWMEGAILDHVRMMMEGRQIYVAPTIEFTPYVYTPFYYAVCALVAKVTGLSFTVARFVSLLSTIGSLLLIGDFVRRETGRAAAGLIAAGLFAVTYELTGFWLDLARVDSLFLFLLLLGLWLARFGESIHAAIGAGAVLFLAFFTKQTGILLAVPALVFGIATHRRRGILSAGLFVALVGGSILWMNARSGGWFTYYVFTVPSRHEWLWKSWNSLLVDFFWAPVAVLVALSFVALVGPALRSRGKHVWLFYSLLMATSFVSSYTSLLHRDGFVNVLIPAYAALCITSTLGFWWIMTEPRFAPMRRYAQVGIIVSFVLLAYNGRRTLPRDGDVRAGRVMLDTLRAQRGPVLMLGSGYYGHMAGHPQINAHAMALADVVKTGDEAMRSRVLGQLHAVVRNGRYPTIILEKGVNLLPPDFSREVRAQYRLEGKLFPDYAPGSTWPKTGYPSRPDEIWVRTRK